MEFTYFAKVDSKSNIVCYVTQVQNDFILDENGNVSIELGLNHLKNSFDDFDEYLWVNITENTGVCNLNYLYLPDYNKFVPEKPYNSWILNMETFDWEPPIPIPSDSNSDTKAYIWVDEARIWVGKDLVQ